MINCCPSLGKTTPIRTRAVYTASSSLHFLPHIKHEVQSAKGQFIKDFAVSRLDRADCKSQENKQKKKFKRTQRHDCTSDDKLRSCTGVRKIRYLFYFWRLYIKYLAALYSMLSYVLSAKHLSDHQCINYYLSNKIK